MLPLSPPCQVDALSTKLKPEPKDEEEAEEEEAMGDVDLWGLAEEGAALTVNSKWLAHLQTRLLGEDGHPRRVQESEDPSSMGLVLEWVSDRAVGAGAGAGAGARCWLSVSASLTTCAVGVSSCASS